MNWILIIGVILVIVIYQISKENREHVDAKVTSHGGMKTKYHTLITFLVNQAGFRVEKVTRDSVKLVAGAGQIYLDYVGDELEVTWDAVLPLLGNQHKKWSFHDGYPQEKMISEIESYADWQVKRVQDLAEK